MTTDPPSLKGRALRLLAAQEYSRAELQRKLAGFEETPGSLAGVLDELQTKGFISEQRVLESVVHRRAAKLGASLIRQELQHKGLDADAVSEAVAALKITELQRAKAVWEKKFGVMTQDAREMAKQVRYLAARGFDGDVIRRVVACRDGDQDVDDVL